MAEKGESPGGLWEAEPLLERSGWILSSYRSLFQRELVAEDGTATRLEAARLLRNAPFVVVAHGTGADPVLIYGNRLSLELWETSLKDFLGTPSRLTAEPVERSEREAMLRRTSRDGFIDDYSGVRISSRGRRFRIEQATVWNLTDSDGSAVGQAAVFAEWRWL